jgi:hypothetical protein
MCDIVSTDKDMGEENDKGVEIAQETVFGFEIVLQCLTSVQNYRYQHAESDSVSKAAVHVSHIPNEAGFPSMLC